MAIEYSSASFLSHNELNQFWTKHERESADASFKKKYLQMQSGRNAPCFVTQMHPTMISQLSAS
jgi:hypothetical protein